MQMFTSRWVHRLPGRRIALIRRRCPSAAYTKIDVTTQRASLLRSDLIDGSETRPKVGVLAVGGNPGHRKIHP